MKYLLLLKDWDGWQSEDAHICTQIFDKVDSAERYLLSIGEDYRPVLYRLEKNKITWMADYTNKASNHYYPDADTYHSTMYMLGGRSVHILGNELTGYCFMLGGEHRNDARFRTIAEAKEYAEQHLGDSIKHPLVFWDNDPNELRKAMEAQL